VINLIPQVRNEPIIFNWEKLLAWLRGFDECLIIWRFHNSLHKTREEYNRQTSILPPFISRNGLNFFIKLCLNPSWIDLRDVNKDTQSTTWESWRLGKQVSLSIVSIIFKKLLGLVRKLLFKPNQHSKCLHKVFWRLEVLFQWSDHLVPHQWLWWSEWINKLNQLLLFLEEDALSYKLGYMW
jgi:hypothetical protein